MQLPHQKNHVRAMIGVFIALIALVGGLVVRERLNAAKEKQQARAVQVDATPGTAVSNTTEQGTSARIHTSASSEVSSSRNTTTLSSNQTEIYVKDTVFIADIAATPALREQGLSGKTGLLDNHVMMFIFPSADKYGFWMKDMLFNIDIVWTDQNGTIVHIEDDLSPDTYPTAYYPKQPAQLVFEFKAGTANAINMKIGDKINFDKNLLKRASR